MAALYGIVALALFASNLAGEFNKGTIRMMFATEPNRLKVLAGKVLALTTYTAEIAATLAISIGAGALMANTVGVETAACGLLTAWRPSAPPPSTSQQLPWSLPATGARRNPRPPRSENVPGVIPSRWDPLPLSSRERRSVR